MKIKIKDIKLDKTQPRQVIDEGYVNNLAKSMATEGLIHPIEIDSNNTIIVGELRYRAAISLGWEEIEVNVNPKQLTEYERLRRQLIENLQQSGSKGGGQPMNVIDTARAYDKLLKAQGYDFRGKNKRLRESQAPLQNLSNELGVPMRNIGDDLELLTRPSFVIEDLLANRPKSAYIEIGSAPEEFRERLEQKVASGEYINYRDIREDASLLRRYPAQAPDILARNRSKENYKYNRVLGEIAKLALALEALPASELGERELGYIKNRLNWLEEQIGGYLNA